MDRRRVVGHLRPPTIADVAKHCDKYRIHLSPDDLEALTASVTALLGAYDLIEEQPEPAPPLHHMHRDPGRAPLPHEDPYNALIRLCEVRGAASGPLQGRTVVVKDCISVAGVPTTHGGRRTPTFVPTEDAVVVERLLDAGAVITAKANMEDSAYGFGDGSAFGPARNPHDPTRSPGGSSSGSAAAVASGIADFGVGADEGGSVRIPAAWCELVGMKPTLGLVPSYGLRYFDHTLAHIGPITKTVADNALLLQVMAGPDPRDHNGSVPQTPPQDFCGAGNRRVAGLRIGVLRSALEPAGCSPGVLESFRSAVSLLEAVGATIIETDVDLWWCGTALHATCFAAGMYGTYTSFGMGFGGDLSRIDPASVATFGAQMQLQCADMPWLVKAQLVMTEFMRDAYQLVPFAKAHNLRLELRRQITALFDDVDLVVTPTTPQVPYELADQRMSPAALAARLQVETVANVAQLNLTGHPALSLPCGRAENDLPVGLQIIGPHFGEEAVYAAAFALEDVRSNRTSAPTR